MSAPFRPFEPEQALSFPPNLREWLPTEHLAYFVLDVAYRVLSGDQKPDHDTMAPDAPLKASLLGARQPINPTRSWVRGIFKPPGGNSRLMI